ncbi:MAG: monofunctional biosynthetic peptidoglycan transglycosylase [Bacteroidia bacterium]|nr:monofunctional biosynthetic peptidoglycan transglycosylase [Bacteroidia bacterium]
MKDKPKGFLRKLWRFVWKSAVLFLILSLVSSLLFRWIPIPVTPLMLWRCVQQKSDGKEMKLEKDWVELDEISPHLQLAVVCSEDQNFLKHFGVDFGALKKAMGENEKNQKKGKKRIRGGSTISMQTSKNVFLWPGRDIIRKGFELYFTFLIEIFWSKERIMEVYLNVIEFGDGIYGAEAASQHYFHKSADKLSKEEAATLAALLPNPRVYGKKIGGNYIQARKVWVLKQMRFWGGKLDYDKEYPEEKTTTK